VVLLVQLQVGQHAEGLGAQAAREPFLRSILYTSNYLICSISTLALIRTCFRDCLKRWIWLLMNKWLILSLKRRGGHF
jgi:hypothetical protein